MPNINDTNRTRAKQLIFEMGEVMSTMPDNDGLGYSALDKEGKLFGERWLNNRDAFEERFKVLDQESDLVKGFGGMVKLKEESKYNSFGIGMAGLEELTAITLHTRNATSERGFKNTHPFVSGQTSIIHNGTIRNAKNLKLEMSTCDSESLLHVYLHHKVNEDLTQLDVALQRVVGTYAFAVFGLDGEGKRILDVVKDDRQDLTMAFVKELNTYVLTTSYDQLVTACKSIGFTIIGVYSVTEKMAARINPITGECLQTTTINPRPSWGQGSDESIVHYKNGEWVQMGGDESKPFEVKTPDYEKGADAVKSFGPSQMAISMARFLNRREKKDIINIAEIKQRLSNIKKEGQLEQIVDCLEKEHGWEKYYDATLREFCFRRKAS